MPTCLFYVTYFCNGDVLFGTVEWTVYASNADINFYSKAANILPKNRLLSQLLSDYHTMILIGFKPTKIQLGGLAQR